MTTTEIVALFGLCFQVSVFGITIVFVRRQAAEARRARELTATRAILEELGAPEVRRIREALFHGGAEKLQETPSRPDLRRIAVAYDRVAYLLDQDLVSEAALYHFQGEEIRLVWNAVATSVKMERDIPSGPDGRKRDGYCRHFEDLAMKWLPSKEANPPKTRGVLLK